MLNDFINALALTNEKFWYYLDTCTMAIVKNKSEIDDMDVTYLAHAYPERFLPLPNKKEIHTYAIMEDYVNTLPNTKGRDKLHHTLQGVGPFKRFKDEVKRQGLEEDWLRYRDERFEQMAREWCAEHRIILSEDAPATPVDSKKARKKKDRHTEGSDVAIALIESIRILFHTLDDASFEAALDELVERLKRS